MNEEEYKEEFESNVTIQILDWYREKYNASLSDEEYLLGNPEAFKKVCYEYWSEYFKIPKGPN